MSSGGPLTGLRVVEMSTAIQGPAAGVFLSDMGGSSAIWCTGATPPAP